MAISKHVKNFLNTLTEDEWLNSDPFKIEMDKKQFIQSIANNDYLSDKAHKLCLFYDSHATDGDNHDESYDQQIKNFCQFCIYNMQEYLKDEYHQDAQSGFENHILLSAKTEFTHRHATRRFIADAAMIFMVFVPVLGWGALLYRSHYARQNNNTFFFSNEKTGRLAAVTGHKNDSKGSLYQPIAII
tara:strand:+ start:684 stop:1244 length:561 start_codon:yes stop_codon:yes gene_type:complete